MVPDPQSFAAAFAVVRAETMRRAAPLSPEDSQVQSMADASPTKWHLAHTTWFFEEFVLQEFEQGFRPHDPRWRFLFNSYYEAVGPRIARLARGLMTRPTLAEVHQWRGAVDRRLVALLQTDPPAAALERTLLGLHHEQQHQELLLTDALHLLAQNPLKPAYSETAAEGAEPAAGASRGGRRSGIWRAFAGGTIEIGAAGSGFAYDNERPRHRALLPPFEFATRLVTQGEFAAFIDAGGYREPRFWLSEGWDWLRRESITGPAYWSGEGSPRRQFTLRGEQPLAPDAPVAHVSFFEADAYARFAGARLPTEQEWEHAALAVAAGAPPVGRDAPPLHGLFDEVWQWTASPYVGYPGFRPVAGAIGEYNGKFMVNQIVLRGSSDFTPTGHSRPTYRNFFPATARWQRTGLRLARDA